MMLAVIQKEMIDNFSQTYLKVMKKVTSLFGAESRRISICILLLAISENMKI